MMMNFHAVGMENAAEMMALLGNLGGTVRGCRWMAHTRRGEKRVSNNRQVVDWLADGERDIRPTEKDATDAAKKFVASVYRYMQIVSKSKKRILKAGPELDAAVAKAQAAGKLKANNASAKAYRAAAMVIKQRMLDRVESGKVNTGSDADKVTKTYAKRRAKKYGIPDDVVFKATGQLVENLADNGAFELVR